jgi:uncharacterized protein (TIGR02466 family)
MRRTKGRPPIRVGVVPVFSTWIYECIDWPVPLLRGLERLTHELMLDEKNATTRTNQGGWHYAFDLFQLTSPLVAQLRARMEQHVQAFLDHVRRVDPPRKDRFRLQGWINVNRAGDTNRLHSHPGSFLSSAYYVKVPKRMKGGNLVFRDPRGPAVAMYETPGLELPWVGSGLGIPFAPSPGKLLLFPSWLEHHVEAFEGDGERISISFNVTNA